MELEQIYQEYKPLLFSLAYQMLGCVMDAEDIVHESFVAFKRVKDTNAVKNVKAYLCKIAANRCIDHLRSAAHNKETYTGTWLPEPIVEDYQEDPLYSVTMKDSISTAYIMLLQQLSEVERTVFILREVLQYEYETIASMVDKSSANCRQIFHRAKKGLAYEPDHSQQDEQKFKHCIEKFTAALQNGEISVMMNMLQNDAVFYADGGGKVKAALRPIYTAERIVHLFLGVMKKLPEDARLTFKKINGEPGVAVMMNHYIAYTVAFALKDEKINSIYMVANPDKLSHLNQTNH
ncbi:RNA polymerase sigma-70 factor [Metabacillus sp. GX 13764]|uniref:RNA polymerase sigma-70 factor n=1 Tax=Metabacillus kandeliae TaxID=2900151 RepID=UPI001E43CB56|nr:RNA polymerase sigma-70 factor [Metabacillus kandeliae]MCD7034419.1 RNA polymerase sigma-70 factor [Metabacillus kandeliae]